jgi:orotate phosphoribosyltransferase
MTSEAGSVLELFRSKSAYLVGHFRLTSGLHSSEYLQSALVLQHPEAAAKLGHMLAEQLRTISNEPVAFVVSPALGGMIIGHEAARALGVRFIFTERDAVSGKMALRRGFAVEPGEAGVVVEDVITTGGSTREVVDLLTQAGARIVAAGTIIDRSGGLADAGAPRVALATLQVAAHYPEQCPMCAEGIPVVKPGSRPNS